MNALRWPLFYLFSKLMLKKLVVLILITLKLIVRLGELSLK